MGPTLAANAMHLDVRRPLLSIRVVIMPNLHDSMKLTRSSTFSLRSGFVRLVALYGSAGLSSGTFALLKDILEKGVDEKGRMRWVDCRFVVEW